MKSFKSIFFAIIFIIILAIIYTMQDGSLSDENRKAKVAVSTFALYDIARHITQDSVELISIIPPGVDVHTYQPTPKTMEKIASSDLVVFSGAVLEPWVASFNFDKRSIGISDFIHFRELDHNEYDSHEHHDEQCAHNTSDPHYWFNIENMVKVTNILTYELIGIAPQHKKLFIDNRDAYLVKLRAVDDAYKKALNSCMLDTIIVNHNAYTYLAKKYNFNIESLMGLSSDAEVTQKEIRRIDKHIKDAQVRVVFGDDLVKSHDMQTIAKNMNIRFDTLNALGNISKQDFDNNATYEQLMLSNLEKISKALVCR